MHSARIPLAVTLLCGVVLSVTGCRSPETEQGVLPVGAFDYQLGGAYEPPPEVQLVARDRTDAPVDGLYSICYINGFQTQPGEQELWPADTLLTIDGELAFDPDWPDEVLLDTSSPSKREAILGVIGPWIEGCARDGFDAVEFDNLDSFTRSHGALTVDDNVALASALAEIAHRAGLAVGQKNAAEYTTRLKQDAGFDFAVAEECAVYTECAAYTGVYGDAVIDIEYTDALPREFAEMCADPESPQSMILRDRDLATPDAPGYVFEACPR